MADTLQAASRIAYECLENSRQEITPKFLNEAGVEYTPTTVETRVTNADATPHSPGDIENWTVVAGWTVGTAIVVEPDLHNVIQAAAGVRELHVFEIVGDRGTVTENPMAADIFVQSRTRRS